MTVSDGRDPAPRSAEAPSDATLLRSLLEESADRVYFKDLEAASCA